MTGSFGPAAHLLILDFLTSGFSYLDTCGIDSDCSSFSWVIKVDERAKEREKRWLDKWIKGCHMSRGEAISKKVVWWYFWVVLHGFGWSFG